MNCDTTKLRELFDRGLSSGIGDADGQVCIEAAISLACGGDLSDSPPCVAEPDRKFSIGINDANWSSPQVRAEALWPLALAQLETAGKDRQRWVDSLVDGTIRRLLPVVFRRTAELIPDHRESLLAAADLCAREGSYAAAVAAARAAAAAARAAAADAAAAAARAAAADAAAAAAAAADAAAAAVAAVAAVAAADAARAAADAAARDEILKLAVQIALDAYEAEKNPQPKASE